MLNSTGQQHTHSTTFYSDWFNYICIRRVLKSWTNVWLLNIHIQYSSVGIKNIKEKPSVMMLCNKNQGNNSSVQTNSSDKYALSYLLLPGFCECVSVGVLKAAVLCPFPKQH